MTAPGIEERVPYRAAGAAQRQAHRRAAGCPHRLPPGHLRTLAAVCDETASYSKLAAHVETLRLAKLANLSVRQLRRALAALAAAGIIVHRAGLGAGNRTVVGIPPDGMKADAYASALGLADRVPFSACESGHSSRPEKGTSTRARESREAFREEEKAVSEDERYGLEPSRRA